VAPDDVSLQAGMTDYGIQYTSALARDNVFAIQCHPEKSAKDGLQLLENFVNWSI
jgi:glutamine amidotransferase